MRAPKKTAPDPSQDRAIAAFIDGTEPTDETTQINCRVSVDDLQKLQQLVMANQLLEKGKRIGPTLSDLVRTAIRQFLEKQTNA